MDTFETTMMLRKTLENVNCDEYRKTKVFAILLGAIVSLVRSRPKPNILRSLHWESEKVANSILSEIDGNIHTLDNDTDYQCWNLGFWINSAQHRIQVAFERLILDALIRLAFRNNLAENFIEGLFKLSMEFRIHWLNSLIMSKDSRATTLLKDIQLRIAEFHQSSRAITELEKLQDEFEEYSNDLNLSSDPANLDGMLVFLRQSRSGAWCLAFISARILRFSQTVRYETSKRRGYGYELEWLITLVAAEHLANIAVDLRFAFELDESIRTYGKKAREETV